MIMDMPQNIDNLDVAQALPQASEVVSITLSTQALSPADLLVSLHNAQATSSISQALSKAIALGPLSVSIPAPTPMGGGTQPVEPKPNIQITLLGEEGWVPPVPMTGNGGNNPPRSEVNLALLDGEEGWIPPLPMGGGGNNPPRSEVNIALLDGEEGWVPPLPMSGGGQPGSGKNVNISFSLIS